MHKMDAVSSINTLVGQMNYLQNGLSKPGLPKPDGGQRLPTHSTNVESGTDAYIRPDKILGHKLDNNVRSCPSLSSSSTNNLQEFSMDFAYEMVTSSSEDVDSAMSYTDSFLLDALQNEMMSCQSSFRKLAEANMNFQKIELKSAVSDKYTCVASQDGVCNVVISTLTVSCDGASLSEEYVTEHTLAAVQESIGLFPLDEVELTYQSMEDEEKALLISNDADKEEAVIEDTSASKEDEPVKEENSKASESSPSANKEPDSATSNEKDSKPVESSHSANEEPDSATVIEMDSKPTESSPTANEEPDSATVIEEDSKPVEISLSNDGEPDSESFKGEEEEEEEEEEEPKKSPPTSVATQSVSNNGDKTLTTKSSKKIGGVVILMVGVGAIAAVLGGILFEKRRRRNEPQRLMEDFKDENSTGIESIVVI